MLRPPSVLAATTLIALIGGPALAQSDAARIAEGRVALDKYQDCDAALTVLKSVSPAAQGNPTWVLYMAKSHECLKQFDQALTHYEAFQALSPDEAGLEDKVAEIRYLARRARAAAEKSARRPNLTGRWERSGHYYRIAQDGDRVEAYRQRDDSILFRATLDGNRGTGTYYMKWSPDAKREALGRCHKVEDHDPERKALKAALDRTYESDFDFEVSEKGDEIEVLIADPVEWTGECQILKRDTPRQAHLRRR